MNRKRYFLNKRKNNRTPKKYMREWVVSKYHLILGGYRGLNLRKQAVALMIKSYLDDKNMTQSEVHSIFEGKRSMDPRTKNDLESLHSLMSGVRKYIQLKGFPLVVYTQRQYLKEVDGRDWVYVVMDEKSAYKPVNKHMGKVSTGVIDRDGRNQNILRMTKKQIQKVLQDVLDELALEAAGLREDKDSK